MILNDKRHLEVLDELIETGLGDTKTYKFLKMSIILENNIERLIGTVDDVEFNYRDTIRDGSIISVQVGKVYKEFVYNDDDVFEKINKWFRSWLIPCYYAS